MKNSFILSDKSEPINLSRPIQTFYTRTRIQMASFIAILFLTAVFASGCVIHDRGHRGRGHFLSPVVVQPSVAVAVPAPVVFTFSDHHRHSVRSYHHEHPRHHGKKHKKWKKRGRGHKRGHGRNHRPHGLRKRDHLPPGIQMQALPGNLHRQLPHPPHGTRYTYYGDQVLLIDLNTRVVLDFIDISISAGY